MILAKIDLSKIDKEYLYKTEKGNYLDLVLIETPNSKYGDYMIKQGVPKDVRESGKDGAILGNGKTFGKKSDGGSSRADDDLPF